MPGSKSLTNRMLALAALGQGPLTLKGALFSEDTRLMAAALRALGFAVREDPSLSTIAVEGLGGRIPAPGADLFVGLAGTAARFLTALCAAAPAGVFRIDGVPQMRKRPMRALIEALRRLGADIRCTGEEGFLPVEVHARGLRGGAVRIDAGESSQMLSALLLVAPLAEAGVSVELTAAVREPFVDMTVQLMRRFGVECVRRPGSFEVRRQPYSFEGREDPGGKAYQVEPDATAASYFLALPLATGGRLVVSRLRRPEPGREALQGDLRFAGVLAEAGMEVRDEAGGLSAEVSPNEAPRGGDWDFREFSDTFLTLAAAAPLLAGPTRIGGIGHTRRQETDRIEAMAAELRKIVGNHNVLTTADSIEIQPVSPDEIRRNVRRRPGEIVPIETYGDHRVAMSFAILGCHPLFGNDRPWIAIRDPACCSKTFPNFFDELARVRKASHLSP